MIFIPAIDLRKNQVVRLAQGLYDEQTAYSDNPLAVAEEFTQAGCERIHVVDLDAAKLGACTQFDIIKAVANAVDAKVQVGGGMRSLEVIESYLNAGIDRVVIGTKACLDPEFLKAALKEFPQRITVGIDSKDGYVATNGWTQVTDIKALDLLKDVEACGGDQVITTDIATDGMLTGPNLSQMLLFCQESTLSIIASGGVSNLDDVRALMNLKQKNLYGVISGKAIYEKKIDVTEAVSLLKEASTC
ncbi:MAG: phosphoribosylformimino-5-aminoimidazole carboxamide ribotide isomerase [Candidatus Omnitrophota bacterium]|jgi:phosphoribosylformimino-5-aminoimidazole carboxamide ribotide isomerase